MASQRFTKYSVNLSVGPWLIWREGVCHAFTLKKKHMEKTKLPVLQQWWQVNARCHGSLWSKTGRAVAASVSNYLLVMRLWFYIKFTLVRLCLDVCCSLPVKHSSSTLSAATAGRHHIPGTQNIWTNFLVLYQFIASGCLGDCSAETPTYPTM